MSKTKKKIGKKKHLTSNPNLPTIDSFFSYLGTGSTTT